MNAYVSKYRKQRNEQYLNDNFNTEQLEILNVMKEKIGEIEREHNKEIQRIKDENENKFPNMELLRKYKYILVTLPHINNRYRIMKKIEIKFKYYVLKGTVYELPNELQYRKKVWLSYEFTTQGRFNTVKVFSNIKMKYTNLFHMNSDGICTGDNTKLIVDITNELNMLEKKTKEIIEFNELINPESLYHGYRDGRMSEIERYVTKKYRENSTDKIKCNGCREYFYPYDLVDESNGEYCNTCYNSVNSIVENL